MGNFLGDPVGHCRERSRCVCCGQRRMYRLGQADCDVQRGGFPRLGFVWPGRYDKPVATNESGVVDHHGQPFQEVGALFQIVDDAAQPSRIRPSRDPVRFVA